MDITFMSLGAGFVVVVVVVGSRGEVKLAFHQQPY